MACCGGMRCGACAPLPFVAMLKLSALFLFLRPQFPFNAELETMSTVVCWMCVGWRGGSCALLSCCGACLRAFAVD